MLCESFKQKHWENADRSQV